MKSSTETKQKRPPDTVEAAGYTDEDAALDAEIKAIAQLQAERAETLTMPEEIAVAPVNESSVLAEHVDDYKPADSHMTLEQQVFECRARKCDSIEATDAVFKSIFGHVPDTHYAMYKNIKLYRIGQVEAGQAHDRVSVEKRLFGDPK